MTVPYQGSYSWYMDITTNHLASCFVFTQELLEDYMVSKRAFILQKNFSEQQIEAILEWEKEKARDGTNRHELVYEYVIRDRINAEHSSGRGSDLTMNARSFFIMLELKTCCASWKVSDQRNRAEIDLSDAKENSDFIVVAIFSLEARKCFYAIIPTSICRNSSGKLNSSLNIEFGADGEPSTRKYKNYMYKTYEDHVQALIRLSNGGSQFVSIVDA